ncbi:hypothetical protein [uncultured Parabacteroides sp.]|jgi:hypothetical protein|uniref:hypothetical protein n=1 Tax=uncultured Parabacteroides sp. TaxID=512312 RepID=UPI0025D37ACD|nr:hypothetical protein [uncultured Parabacteroides sp.]
MKYTNPDHLILLIQSLTKAEKRYFRLYANLQSGEKNYLLLFDLINKGTPTEESYQTEELLFRFVMAYPLPAYQKSQSKLWIQFQKEITKIRQDKYEKQLLKSFDILSWIESRLTDKPFAEVLAENNI